MRRKRATILNPQQQKRERILPVHVSPSPWKPLGQAPHLNNLTISVFTKSMVSTFKGTLKHSTSWKHGLSEHRLGSENKVK